MAGAQRIIIYQVLPRLFGNDHSLCRPNGSRQENGCGLMADFTQRALGEIRRLGATHVWFTGILRHANETTPAPSKGRAGSPYAITDYYDVDPDLAASTDGLREFRNLVRRTHRAGLGVVIDFVPNHVSRHYHSTLFPQEDFGRNDDTSLAFAPQNNFYYVPGEELHLPQGVAPGYSERPARATGNDVFHAWPSATDWYETVKLNYGVDYQGGRAEHFQPVPDTWQKMFRILRYWAAMGVDGFRCDMAEMVPVAFWEWAIPRVKEQHPDILFIAEVYNPGLYREYIHRGGFDLLYDKVGLYDTLRAVVCGQASAQQLTQCWQQVDDIRHHMLYFLENHDEQRLASDFFAGNGERGRAPLLVAALLSRNPFMLYFGQELGERGMDEEGFSGRDGRTTIFDYWSLSTIRRWRNGGSFDGAALTADELQLREFYNRVLTLCCENDVLRQGSSFDLMYANPHLHRQFAFVRQWEDQLVLVVANFDERDVQVSLSLPHHLFEFCHMVDGQTLEATSLLCEGHTTLSLSSATPLSLPVPPLGGVVLEMKYSRLG